MKFKISKSQWEETGKKAGWIANNKLSAVFQNDPSLDNIPGIGNRVEEREGREAMRASIMDMFFNLPVELQKKAMQISNGKISSLFSKYIGNFEGLKKDLMAK